MVLVLYLPLDLHYLTRLEVLGIHRPHHHHSAPSRKQLPPTILLHAFLVPLLVLALKELLLQRLLRPQLPHNRSIRLRGPALEGLGRVMKMTSFGHSHHPHRHPANMYHNNEEVVARQVELENLTLIETLFVPGAFEMWAKNLDGEALPQVVVKVV